MKIRPLKDKIVFSPRDIKKDFRPLSKDINKDTYILGTFNPGMARLKNGNIILMIRVAEALTQSKNNAFVLTPRMDLKKKKYTIDAYPKKSVNLTLKDPRGFDIKQKNQTIASRLTSTSWILPVEMSSDGMEIIKIHYNKVLFPIKNYQEFGLEDPRISKIGKKYYMTVVGVSSIKLCTCLYESNNGLDYKLKSIIFDHQNKDVALFPTKIKKNYFALSRPEGAFYCAPHIKSDVIAGACINAAFSTNLQYWAPTEDCVLTLRKRTRINKRIGVGAPPILVKINKKEYWLELFHGVEHIKKDPIGTYRTYAAFLEKNNPTKVIKVNYNPLLEYNPKLKTQIKGKPFMKDIVFTTGIIPNKETYLVCSGELDTAVRMTTFSKNSILNLFNL